MSTTSGAIFNGSSSYAADFQNLINRATAIASLPINQLNTDKTNLTSQSTELTTIDGKFQAIQAAVDRIAGAISGASFQADVSDTAKVSVSLSAGAMEGNYMVDVVDPGAYATSMTKGAWIAPSGAARDYRIALGGTTYSVAAADNSAASVASAINAQYGDKVRATVVNVGSASSPDYRISLQASALGDLKPSLFTGPEAPTALQTQQATGSDTRAASQTAVTWDANPALTFQLSLGGRTYALAPVDNSAQSVADAINAAYGDRVTASVVNLGDQITPDYRVSLTAVDAGNVAPDILASDGISGPASLQQQTAAGSDTLASSRTTTTWSNDPGPTLTYQLSLGGVKYDLSPANNTADSVVSEINSRYGDKVTAAVVDLGSGSVHDYRISLTATKPGDVKPDLIVSEVDLQEQQTTGSLAHYVVNNSGKDVTSSSRTVSIATGVNVTLAEKTSGTPVNITVTRPTSALSDALAAFTEAYNGAVDELDKQRGTSGGALAGQSLVTDLSRALSEMGAYSSGSGIGALANLGVELDRSGHLTFSPLKLLGADLTSSSAVTAFLGSSTSGFIKSATDALNSIEAPLTGTLAAAKGAIESQITELTGTIAEKQARVDDMTQRMQDQMAAADALIASMQQQYSYMFDMFSAMRSQSESYK